jgi:hypothetical protein
MAFLESSDQGEDDNDGDDDPDNQQRGDHHSATALGPPIERLF